MKKVYLLAAAAMLATTASNATTFGNPTEEYDGNTYYIVKWDPETHAFASSNDWEIDETFIFAIDVKGTPLESALETPSRNTAVLGRGVAYDLYVTNAPEDATGTNIDGRLVHIEGTIYGLTMNFFQQHTSRYKDSGLWPNEDYTEYGATTVGNVVTWDSNIFGFGWSADNPGQEWWDAVASPIQGEFAFRCAPYTGTKTSPLYYYADSDADSCPFEGLDPAAYHSMCDSWGGYAAPSDYDKVASVKNVLSESSSPVVSTEYYNIQGMRLNEVPQKGLYIERNIKADGSSKVSKIVK
jgi:hypothetical protein